MKKGSLIISLDFELFWGIFDHANVEDKKKYFDNTLKVIPEILSLFEKYQIKATWATVGFLFFKDLNELLQNLPDIQPQYIQKKLSAYHFIKDNQKLIEKNLSYFFAPDMIQKISKTTGQEIATHTFSHYYCLEEGQNEEDFKKDIKAFKNIADKLDIKTESLVFPRNQYNKNYLDICIQQGLKVIRTNPDYWFWDMSRSETFIKKIIRTLDAYMPIGNMSFDSSHIQFYKNKLVLLPASRFYRPVEKNVLLNKLRLRRIIKEMEKAAINKRFYHLWWHPHNFGLYPQQSLKELEELLNHFALLKENYGMESLAMSDFYTLINNNNLV